jgi:hypothetical protein
MGNECRCADQCDVLALTFLARTQAQCLTPNGDQIKERRENGKASSQ